MRYALVVWHNIRESGTCTFFSLQAREAYLRSTKGPLEERVRGGSPATMRLLRMGQWGNGGSIGVVQRACLHQP